MIPISRYRVPIALVLVGAIGIGCGAPPDPINAVNATNSSGPSTPVSSPDSQTVSSGGAGTETLVRTRSAIDWSNKYAFVNTLKQVGSWASDLAGFFSAVTTAIGLARALGILHDPSQDIVVALQALHQQIDQDTTEVTWLMTETERENRLSDLRSTVFTTYDAVNSGASVDWSSIDQSTAQTVGEGAVPAAFLRLYHDTDTDGIGVPTLYGTEVTWKTFITYTQQDLQAANGYVYDWRLGLPALMQLIALRLQLMAMEDPNFATDFRFSSELMSYYYDMVNHINNLNFGLRCNMEEDPPYINPDNPELSVHAYQYFISCADIFSGVNNTVLVAHDDSTYPFDVSNCIIYDAHDGVTPPIYDQACLDQASIDYNSWYQANVQTALTNAYYATRYQTPWFSAQALMDTLYTYANGLTDPTRADPAIHVSANTGLCLDVYGASPDAETPVEIYSCNGNAASQSWAYDRVSQNIVEPYSGLCLDVINGSWMPGTQLWTYWCNGTDAQKWTYDPVNHIFNNALGNVLDVPNDNLQSLQRVQTGVWTGGDSQRWQ